MPAEVKPNVCGPAPPQPQRDSLGPSQRAARSAALSRLAPRGAFQSETDALCHLGLSCSFVSSCTPKESPAAENQPPEAKTQHAPPSASPSLPGEGHRKNNSGPLTAEHRAGQEPVPHQGCFGNSRALRVSCCLIYIKRRIKFL